LASCSARSVGFSLGFWGLVVGVGGGDLAGVLVLVLVLVLVDRSRTVNLGFVVVLILVLVIVLLLLLLLVLPMLICGLHIDWRMEGM